MQALPPSRTMNTYRRWTPPIASRHSDIHGWLQDIHSARDLARRLIKEAESGNPDLDLLDALSTTSLIRYSRCFTTGIRERLDIARLPSATDLDVALHKRLRGIRDWHIAHPVNQQEAHALYVIVDESPGATTGALGVSSLLSAELPMKPFEAEEMVALCGKWIIWLDEQLRQEQLRLMPFAKQLTRKELLSFPQGDPQTNEDIYAKRKQQQREA